MSWTQSRMLSRLSDAQDTKKVPSRRARGSNGFGTSHSSDRQVVVNVDRAVFPALDISGIRHLAVLRTLVTVGRYVALMFATWRQSPFSMEKCLILFESESQ